MFELTYSDLQAVLLSAKVALAATALALPFGFMAAYLLVFRSFRGKSLIEGALNLPLVLPPVVVGYLLLLLGERGPLGSLLKVPRKLRNP